jgi:hypothetical protein
LKQSSGLLQRKHPILILPYLYQRRPALAKRQQSGPEKHWGTLACEFKTKDSLAISDFSIYDLMSPIGLKETPTAKSALCKEGSLRKIEANLLRTFF